MLSSFHEQLVKAMRRSIEAHLFMMLLFFGCGTRLTLHSLPATLSATSLVGDIAVVPGAVLHNKAPWQLRWSDICQKHQESYAHVYAVSQAALLGAWLGSFPVHLDWMQSWQAWPLPVVFASLAASSATGCVYALLYWRSRCSRRVH